MQKKYAAIQLREERYENYLLDDADVVLVAYGISARLAKNAADDLRKYGVKAGVLRPQTLFPFPNKACRNYAKQARIFICIELSCGQMIRDVRLAVNGEIRVELINRMGGNILTVDEIIEKVSKLI